MRRTQLRNGLVGLCIAAAALALLYQARPILVYHASVAPLVAVNPAAEAGVLTEIATPPGWSTVRVANLSIAAPLEPSGAARCASCASHCVLPTGDGTLAIFDSVPPETLDEALDGLAPRVDDLSLWRARSRNWQTLASLARRAGTPSAQETFRFETRRARGIVKRHRRDEEDHFVVYAYSAEAAPTRMIGLTSISRADLSRVIGSLEVGPTTNLPASATCTRGVRRG